MRVISGYLKGRKLIDPKDNFTRPLKDLTKESIFNFITHANIDFKIKNSKILDLFSGTGSFGIECISRGASNVTFFENYPEAIKVLTSNIEKFSINKQTEIIKSNFLNYNFTNRLNRRFDLIFLDPPYKEKNINIIFQNIKQKQILTKNGLVILHRNKKTFDEITNDFLEIDKRVYGISKIIYFKLR